MPFVTIDNYYSVKFYNQTKEALKNNGIEFKEYISSKPPYDFYFGVDNVPMFLNYDEANKSYTRWLVNLVRPLTPNSAYIYERRESYVNKKAIRHYAINDALGSGVKSGEGIFFTATKDRILKLSKEFPRKIYFMGRYYNKRYTLFFCDNVLIKNYLNSEDILVYDANISNEGDIMKMEVELNYKVFQEKDRLEKLSETPYVYKGRYYPIKSTIPEISDMYVLS